ncbi:Palmitoyl-protein thioesterase 1 [Grifola frondosa]|uniref:Palmitoyl-protein thioesterase 1 n=1 Tax=Grifola frondosa TaxID=5627 RepID=A0A1C7LTP8_GRIFR|nr:Palmitoyl-protein thioesterase 1 [Grifola frondosa]
MSHWPLTIHRRRSFQEPQEELVESTFTYYTAIESMQADSDDSSPTATYHPLFSSSDGDVILGSKDGTLFRVHTFTLKMTSGWFRTMFSLPQKSSASTPDVIYVDEDAATLEDLLRMICGLTIPRLDSYDVIEPLLHAAEKYDMPGPMSIVRRLVMTPPLVDDPLRLYALTCRYGWQDEAMMASKYTLTLNLHAPEHRNTLKKLGTDSLLNLFQLHRFRRETLRGRLDDPPFVSDGGDTSCSHCGSAVDYHTWRELKYVIIMEMDSRPLGDTVCSSGLLEWPAARACWNAKCATCDKVLYDKTLTMRVIRECIDSLPTTVEDRNLAVEGVIVHVHVRITMAFDLFSLRGLRSRSSQPETRRRVNEARVARDMAAVSQRLPVLILLPLSFALGVPLRSSFSKPRPLVIWHGLGDSYASPGMLEFMSLIKDIHPGIFIHSIFLNENLKEDERAGFYGNVNEQVQVVSEQLANITELREGFDAIGFSQGGQFLRAYVERYNSPPLNNLITFGSQHMGISDIPLCRPWDVLCQLARRAARNGVYTEWAQNNLVQACHFLAQYFRDPSQLEFYLESNRFLTSINNEIPASANSTYMQNLASLNKLVLVLFSADKTVVPKESSWFGSYAVANDTEARDDKTIVPMRLQPLYTEDWIGLRTLDERGDVLLETCEGEHMQLSSECWQPLVKRFVGGPVSSDRLSESESVLRVQ